MKIPFRIPFRDGRLADRFVYSYAIFGTEITLIDCGVKDSCAVIFDAVSRAGRNPKAISRLVLTHSHPDHIGGALDLKERCGCSILAHPAERNWIEHVDRQAAERPVPGFESLVAGSVEVDAMIGDGDVVDLGDGLELHVMHTPGHSRGSISLHLPACGALFTGDAVPPPGSMPIYEDVAASVRSIGRLMRVDGVDILYSSWIDPAPGADAGKALAGGLAHLQAVHDAVRKFAAGGHPQDPMDLCRKVVERLGLPEYAANTLVAASMTAHMELLDTEVLAP